MLVAMTGLPGTGKSTLAGAMVTALRARGRSVSILDKDRVRAALFEPDDIAYTREQDDLCIDVMLEVAAYLLRHTPRRIVILDGRTFSRRDQAQTVVDAASRMGAALRFIECTCSEDTALQRLAHDHADGAHVAKDRTPELYRSVKARAQTLTVTHLIIDTGEPMVGNVQECLAYLASDELGSDSRPTAPPLP